MNSHQEVSMLKELRDREAELEGPCLRSVIIPEMFEAEGHPFPSEKLVELGYSTAWNCETGWEWVKLLPWAETMADVLAFEVENGLSI